MTIKKTLTSQISRLAGASLVLSTIAWQLQAMLVNSKEIAEDLKAAIIEAGNQVSSDFKPLWPNKNSCFTSLGVLCAAGGMLLVYQGFSHIVNNCGKSDDYLATKKGCAKIILGLIACALGIITIHTFGQ